MNWKHNKRHETENNSRCVGAKYTGIIRLSINRKEEGRNRGARTYRRSGEAYNELTTRILEMTEKKIKKVVSKLIVLCLAVAQREYQPRGQ